MLLSNCDLTFFMPIFPLYRNQSIDLDYKSIDWFLYEGNIGMKKVKSAAPNLELFQQDNRQLFKHKNGHIYLLYMMHIVVIKYFMKWHRKWRNQMFPVIENVK